jgi:hypothetical protein
MADYFRNLKVYSGSSTATHDPQTDVKIRPKNTVVNNNLAGSSAAITISVSTDKGNSFSDTFTVPSGVSQPLPGLSYDQIKVTNAGGSSYEIIMFY